MFRSTEMEFSFLYGDEFDVIESVDLGNCSFVAIDSQAELCQRLKFGKGNQEIWYVGVYIYPSDTFQAITDNLTDYIYQNLEDKFGAGNVKQANNSTELNETTDTNTQLFVNVKLVDAKDPWGSRQIAIHIAQDEGYTAILYAVLTSGADDTAPLARGGQPGTVVADSPRTVLTGEGWASRSIGIVGIWRGPCEPGGFPVGTG